MDDATVEKVARAIAGDDWAAAFDSRQMQRICEGAEGKYRDVNQPSKDEYRDMARDAIAAFLADLEARGMCVVPEHPSYKTQQRLCNLWCCTDEEAVDTYAEVLAIVTADRAMIAASEGGEG